jgi:hypothetical protein
MTDKWVRVIRKCGMVHVSVITSIIFVLRNLKINRVQGGLGDPWLGIG